MPVQSRRRQVVAVQRAPLEVPPDVPRRAELPPAQQAAPALDAELQLELAERRVVEARVGVGREGA